ncbi:MAG: hypothetical protein JSR77_03155 [Planctomycetes bacterium]|nr:hypothetical protein [Planctomycetota bacterium]
MLSISCAAFAQEPAINRDAIRPVFDKMKTGRADVVGIGDSNEFMLGVGWDEGWTRVLNQRYGLYATELLALGESSGVGSGAGYGVSVFSTYSSAEFQYAGAPAELDNYLNNPPSLLAPLNYLYVPEGDAVAGTIGNGITLATDCPVSVNAPVRFHLLYGLFPGAGPGEIRPILRRDTSPFTILAQTPVLTTRSGPGQPARVASIALDLPRSRRSYPISMRMAGPFDSIVGPAMGLYARVEDTSASHGASFSTLYGMGSQSLRDMAAALQASSDDTLTLYFTSIRALQDEPRRVLVRIASGLNDRAEPLPSVGPAHIAAGNSAAAYEDNLRAILARITEIWVANGWPEEELHFLVTPSHPVADPDDPMLLAYRDRADAVAMSSPRTASVRLDRLTSATEMLADGWYQLGGFDRNHLNPPYYQVLAQRELLSLISLACPADFNEDGGIDGADVEAFYQTWRTGDLFADVNQDGGVDGSDVESFFELWSAGGC